MKGLPNVANHVTVRTTECVDDLNSEFPLGVMCASATGRDSCQGDSGGPLIVKSTTRNNKYVWAGEIEKEPSVPTSA